MYHSMFKRVFAAIALLFTLSLTVSAPLALAQTTSTCTGEDCGIAVGGTDKSSEFSAITNLFKTIQTLAVRYAAPVGGTLLIIFGIYQLAMRNAMPGTIALVCGGLMIIVPVLVQNAAKMGQ
ncbi:MAG TPA: hypothetical protein VE954_00665 [Oligoflexus sp.]|uniref:hypothetical protein n=1 Tax=Oligoflexus sp. TaxID=1971216 RepID=UPI002D668647|nr:hypothetical protein [Oligoflexus sp.]HYX31591.1 hypothetical protein [Oligoflexus sp.]